MYPEKCNSSVNLARNAAVVLFVGQLITRLLQMNLQFIFYLIRKIGIDL